MKKFALIGVGRLHFTTLCIKDLITFPAFEDAHFCLMDIKQENIDRTMVAIKRIIKESGNTKCKITTTTDRIEA